MDSKFLYWSIAFVSSTKIEIESSWIEWDQMELEEVAELGESYVLAITPVARS